VIHCESLNIYDIWKWSTLIVKIYIDEDIVKVLKAHVCQSCMYLGRFADDVLDDLRIPLKGCGASVNIYCLGTDTNFQAGDGSRVNLLAIRL
jgi:hypothetical protein